MRRPSKAQVAVFVVTFVVVFVVAHSVMAHAKTSSPAPDGVGSDCSWQEHGRTEVIGGEEFTCHCARLNGPNGAEILCRWWNTASLPKPTRKLKKHAAKKPAKFGIASAALSAKGAA